MNTLDRIMNLLQNTKREGMEGLIEWMVEGEFFLAPASTKFHGARAGGLAEHSLAVHNNLINLPFDVLTLDHDTTAGKKPLPITPQGIIIAPLLHDIYKVGAYIATPDGKNPYKWNNEQPEGHALLSIEWIKKHIKLEPIEELMIRFHHGVWGTYEYYEEGTWEYNTQPEYHIRSQKKKPKNPTPEEKKADQKARYGKSWRNAIYHNPLVYWMHVADMLATAEDKQKGD